MMKLWIALLATCVTFAFGSTIAPAATTTQDITTTAAAPATTAAAPATTAAAGSNATGGSTGNSSTAASASTAAAAQTNQTAGNSTTAPASTPTHTTTISQVTNSVTESSSTGSTTNTTTQAPVYNCTSGEFNTTGLTYSMCSAGCYAVLNNNKITYGCADIVKTALNETWGFEVCSGDKKYGVCRDITVSGKKSESCVICCAESNCNEVINNREAFKRTKPESQNSAASVVGNLVSVFIVALFSKLF